MEHHDQSLAIKTISIQTIYHDQQRMNTVGDYLENSPGHWVILVSETGDWRMNMLIAFHELAELLQIVNDGVTEQSVTDFDEQFEKDHADSDEEEPGNDPKAPYHNQHVFACAVETLLMQKLGVNLNDYDKAVNNLWRPKKSA